MHKGEVFQRLDLEIAVCVGGARAPVSEVCNASRVPGFFFFLVSDVSFCGRPCFVNFS